jgi:hypothetical protein
VCGDNNSVHSKQIRQQVSADKLWLSCASVAVEALERPGGVVGEVYTAGGYQQADKTANVSKQACLRACVLLGRYAGVLGPGMCERCWRCTACNRTCDVLQRCMPWLRQGQLWLFTPQQ